MKLLFYFFFIAVSIASCNNGKGEQQNAIIDTIATSKTDTGTIASFPGSAIYIKLPKGFVWDETAMGFYRDADGSVIRYDEFKTIRHAANMPVDDRMGSLTNRQPVTVSGYKGEMKTYQLSNTGFKLELSFGDDTLRFIESTYFTVREETETEILAALKTIQIKK
jgi:hypothetical protein